MMETKQVKETGKVKLNVMLNQCEYCECTPNVLYVFAADDNINIAEFQLCLACRNYIVLRMKVLIENKKAQIKENKKRALTKNVKRSENR